MSHQPPLTEAAELTHCTRCGRPVIRAHADGLLTICDPQPLTPIAELATHLDRRASHQLIPIAHHLELQWRSAIHIRSNHRAAAILADHRCSGPRLNTRQVQALPPSIVLTAYNSRRQELADEPPF